MMGFAKPVWRPGAERGYLAEIDEGGVEVIYDRMKKLLEILTVLTNLISTTQRMVYVAC